MLFGRFWHTAPESFHPPFVNVTVYSSGKQDPKLISRVLNIDLPTIGVSPIKHKKTLLQTSFISESIGMSLTTAILQSAFQGRFARIIAFLCFGLACSFLAHSLLDPDRAMRAAPSGTSLAGQR